MKRNIFFHLFMEYNYMYYIYLIDVVCIYIYKKIRIEDQKKKYTDIWYMSIIECLCIYTIYIKTICI